MNMNCYPLKNSSLVILFFFSHLVVNGQHLFEIAGSITDSANNTIAGASVRLTGGNAGTITKADGSFSIRTSKWSDTLKISNAGFQDRSVVLHKDHTTGLSFRLTTHLSLLDDIVINLATADKEPGRRFMKKVIAAKKLNDPNRFKNYSYSQYSRHEIDINNLDTAQKNNKGLKNLTVNIYRGGDSLNASSTILPIYFSETLSNKYHNILPAIEKENVLAKKRLGLQTDGLLQKLDKFNFNFNIYDDWLPVFSQTYASPLSNTAFNYYNFYFNDSTIVNGKKQYHIHFAPRQKFERAFTGSLWINDSTYSISKIDMRLTKTANLNFVSDIHYAETYKLSFDSATSKLEYMPFKYSSKIDFETGAALVGIPVKPNEKSLRLTAVNTTVISNLKFNVDAPNDSGFIRMNTEATTEWEKDATYWKLHRPDTLTRHEKDIYIMVDSLQKNTGYKRKTKLINTLGTGYWNVDNKILIGPLTSALSTTLMEGLRSRIGFSTLPSVSKKVNINTYIAYGTKDHLLKGHLGVQYLWDAVKWSKTSFNLTSDYNYPIEKEDELDDDNLLTSMLRKNIPAVNIFVRSFILKHEQCLSKNWTAKASAAYKELLPVFPFTYHPLDKFDKPIDSISQRKLPVAEFTAGLRFTKGQRTSIFNYNLVKLNNFNPVVTANFTYGFEFDKAQFHYEKLDVGIEQNLRLPPKAIFYYRLTAGKTLGTASYLLLDVPGGNETYVDSKYNFNTMLPYEYAADQFLSLHTRLYTGGMLLDKIPFLNKMGLRERCSFNMYMGSMSSANKLYNNNASFDVTGNKPFMETGIGVENIFHLLSLDYFWRLSKTANAGVSKGGLFLGMRVEF